MAIVNTADTSLVSIRYGKETAIGEVPTGGLTELPITSEDLVINRGGTQSERIRSDRSVADIVNTEYSLAGSLSTEFSAKTLDPFLEAAMFDTWVPLNGTNDMFTVPGTVTAAPASGNNAAKFTFSNALAGVDIKPGQSILVSGFTGNAASNNGLVTVRAINSGKTELQVLEPLVAVSNASGIKLKSARLENGTTRSSFTIERDIAKPGSGGSLEHFYTRFLGMVPNTLSLELSTGSIVTASIGFVGLSGVLASAAISGTPRPDPGGDVMNTVEDVGSVKMKLRDPLNPTVDIFSEVGLLSSISLELNNNLRNKQAIGTLGSVDVGVGTFNLSGSLTAYLKDLSIYQRYVESLDSAIQIPLIKKGGNGYVFYMPRIKFEEANIPTPGQNQDVLVNGSYQAILDNTAANQGGTAKTMIISRV